MRIQDLAIIFIIIILPISIVLGAYTQMQISTISLQTEYDMKLIAATSDAIKAFQINTANSSTSDIANSKIRDIEASVSTFKASIKSVFGMNGYSEDEMNEYIPALVYTMYDGFYIYSRFNNQNYLYEVDENGNVTNNPLDKNGENVFGLKPYISYSVKYNPNSDLDIVITYSLDNYISIKGMVKVDGEKQYWDKSGYLIDGIKKDASGKITYNGVEIDKNVVLSEDLPAIGSLEKGTYKYVRYNGTKYYLDERNARVIYFLNGNLMEINPTSDYDKYKDMIEKGESLSEELPQIGTLARGNYKYIVYNGTKYYLDERNTRIIYFLNGNLMEIKPKLDENIESSYKKYENMIENGESAYKFYDEANKFTQSVKNVLANLTNKDAQDFIINSNGETIQTTVFSDETEYKIFDFNSDSSKPEKNIECRSSNFNQHRLAVIKNKIRTNLAIAITNFNSAYNIEFQMPELTEEDWAKAMNNISLISFIQGIDIGGKTYNGYTIINNSESKEVVREENIYILGNDGFYHRIGDKYLLEANNIGGNSEYNSNVNASGRLNLDFNKQRAYTEDGSTVYYYPISKYYASYNSIVNQNYWDKDYDNYNDIYAYVATKNVNLRKAFYMALGRERYGMYKSN
ncbi:MAG TPA: hypothetical protein DIU30_00510 [Clostridiales bacterium]|jgi:hypothetical protein|nr:hypothetical protein [Clostridiales bacterium]